MVKSLSWKWWRSSWFKQSETYRKFENKWAFSFLKLENFFIIFWNRRFCDINCVCQSRVWNGKVFGESLAKISWYLEARYATCFCFLKECGLAAEIIILPSLFRSLSNQVGRLWRSNYSGEQVRSNTPIRRYSFTNFHRWELKTLRRKALLDTVVW